MAIKSPKFQNKSKLLEILHTKLSQLVLCYKKKLSRLVAPSGGYTIGSYLTRGRDVWWKPYNSSSHQI